MAEKLRPFFYTLRFLYFLTLLKKYFESYVCMAYLKKFSILAKNQKEIIEFKIIKSLIFSASIKPYCFRDISRKNVWLRELGGSEKNIRDVSGLSRIWN